MFNASKINARFTKAFILEGLNTILRFNYFYINLKLECLLCYHSDSNLITTHCVFPVVIWSTFAIHCCFCFLFFYIIDKMVFLPINSLKFFACLKNTGWFLNILVRSLFTCFHCF